MKMTRRDSHGFTLIELLIVVLLISVLASIALGRFTRTRERSQIAAMQSDLRNLATSQENYFVNNLAYTTTLADLEFNVSEAVSISIPVGNVTGWRATASHTAVANTDCEIYYGDATGASTASQPAIVMCG